MISPPPLSICHRLPERPEESQDQYFRLGSLKSTRNNLYVSGFLNQIAVLFYSVFLGQCYSVCD